MTAPAGHDAEHGSIVIEAMIATLIIAAMAGAVFETIAAQVASARALTARQEAMLVAQSRLALVGSQIAVDPGSVNGTDGSLAWRIDIMPYPVDGASDAGTLERVTVTVRDATTHGAPLAVLQSLRLGR